MTVQNNNRPDLGLLKYCTTIRLRRVVWFFETSIVPDPGKGVCADPANGGAILGKGGPDPQGGNGERQLNPDKGREKT